MEDKVDFDELLALSAGEAPKREGDDGGIKSALPGPNDPAAAGSDGHVGDGVCDDGPDVFVPEDGGDDEHAEGEPPCPDVVPAVDGERDPADGDAGEIASFMDSLGVTFGDDDPMVASLVLGARLLSAAKGIGVAFADGSGRLSDVMEAGHASRVEVLAAVGDVGGKAFLAADRVALAASEVAAAGSAAADAVGDAMSEWEVKLSAGMAAASERLKGDVARKVDLVISDASRTWVSKVRVAGEEMVGRQRLDLENAGVLAAGAVSKELATHVPKIREAVRSGVLRAEAERAKADPWRWRRWAAVGVSAVLALCVVYGGAWWAGRSSGLAEAAVSRVA